jgi:hypothetical protein
MQKALKDWIQMLNGIDFHHNYLRKWNGSWQKDSL